MFGCDEKCEHIPHYSDALNMTLAIKKSDEQSDIIHTTQSSQKVSPSQTLYSCSTNTVLSLTLLSSFSTTSLGCTTCLPFHPFIRLSIRLRMPYCNHSGNPLSLGATSHAASGSISDLLFPPSTALTISSATVSGNSAFESKPSNSFVRVYPWHMSTVRTAGAL